MGYLGKISAVVSVNTGDFAAKLNRCAGDVKNFAAATERELKTASRSAAKSFGNIYTDVQKLERALRAATSLKLDFSGLKGFEGKSLQEAADHMRQIHSIASQISAPMGDIAKKTESLAAALRGKVHPAFEATQTMVEEMQSTVAGGTSVSIRRFTELAAIVRKTGEAIERVSQAGKSVGDLTGGKDFRTQSPQAFAALERAKAAQQSAYALPAGAISPAPSLLARQKAAAMAVAAASAAVESKRDLGQDQTKVLADLKKKIALLDQVNSLIEKEVSDYNNAAAAIAKQTQDAATLLKLQQSYTRSITGQVQSIAQLSSAYDGLIARAEKLRPKQRTALDAGGFGVSADKVRETIAGGDEAKVGSARTALASMESAVSGVENLNLRQEAAKKSADALRESLAKIADSIGTPAAPIDAAREAIDRMNASVEKLKDPAKKATAQGVAQSIRQDIEAEVTRSKAAGTAPDDGVIDRARRRAGKLADAADAVNSRKTATDLFGPAIGSSERKIDILKTKVVALHGEFDKLPEPLQKLTGGALTKLREDFERLTPASAAADVHQIADEYQRLEAFIKRASQTEKFGDSFGKFLTDTTASQQITQLNAIQTAMARVGAAAGGPTAAAIDKYRAALLSAHAAGTLATDGVRKQLSGLVDEIEKASVEEGVLTPQRARAVMGGAKHAGDVGRGGADKASLALNQAAYAVDDFMSSTGGFEQKIRAISNNLTQMGFILDGTRGLWVMLTAVIATQATMAIYKYINNGKTADDTNKALNESLDKQKSLVGELAAAYRDLAKSMALSSTAQRGVANSEVIGGVARANFNNRTQKMVGVDAASVAERATQLAIKRQMESSTATGRAGTLIFREEQLKQSEARARLAEAEARKRPPARNAEELRQMKERRAVVSAEMGANTGARAAQALGFDPAGSFVSFLATMAGPLGSKFRQSAEELEVLEARIRATEGVFDEFSDKIGQAAIESSQVARMRIEAASALIASAIESGIPGARKFQNELDSLSLEIAAALTALADAADRPAEQRREATQAAQDKIGEAFARTADIIAKTLPMRIKAAFTGPSSSDVLGSLTGEEPAGVKAQVVGASARMDVAAAQLGNADAQAATAIAEANRIKADGERRVADAKKALADVKMIPVPVGDEQNDPYVKKAMEEQRQRVEAAKREVDTQSKDAEKANQAAQANVAAAEAARGKARADEEAARAADRLAAAAAQAAMDLVQSSSRTRKIISSSTATAEQAADDAQKRFNEKPTDARFAEREAAEQRLIEARQREAEIKARLKKTMSQAEQNPVVKEASALIEENKEKLRKIQASAAETGFIPDAEEVRTIESQIAAQQRRRDEEIARMTAVDRFQADFEAARAAKEQRDAVEARPEFGREARAAERDRVRQGREDAMTVRQRQTLDAERSAENMAAAAGAIGNQVDRQAFVEKYYANKKKEILKAGPLGQAEEERFNSQFGTRRLGLDATDATKTEGQRELNRLLRGDDANKDVNFAEMQKQSELLQDIRDAVLANTGMVIDVP